MVLRYSKYFQSVIDLMNRLRYPQKFALISLVFSLPMVLLTYLLMAEIHSRIEFSQREIYGDRYLRPLRKVWQEALNGQVSVKVSQQQSDTKVNIESLNQAIAELKLIEQELGGILQTNLKFTKLQSAINTLGISDNRQNGFIYSQILEQVKQLRSHVGDSSNLILDPDLDTYYLMDASLLKLPSMQQILTNIETLNLAIAKNAEINPQQKGELTQLVGLLKSDVQNLKQGMETSFEQNKDGEVKSNLTQPLERYLSELNLLLSNLELSIQSNNYVPLNQKLIVSTKAESFGLWDQVVDQLDSLLEKRISEFEQRRLVVLVFIVVMGIIVVYLFTAFYLSVMQTVNELERVARQMSLGQFEQEFTVETKDELGMVVRSFNRVAKALQRAEEKYRSIFENSVEGIFQTTPDGQYLSANNALAHIYGYENSDQLITDITAIDEQLYVEKDRRSDFVELIEAYNQVTEFESEVYRKDGSKVWISESVRAVRNEQGDTIYYEGIVQDISDRKIAEEQLAVANIKISNLAKRLKQENLRMSAELEITQRLQSMILPRPEELTNLAGIQISGYMEPASEVGGDYYDVLQHNGRIKIAIGDVTGHGLESGLLMVMVQTAVRTLIESNETDAVRFMDVLNRTIFGNVQRMNSDKNLSFSLVDYAGGKLFLSGQHEEMILVRAGGVVERFDTIDLGFPIGLEENISSLVDRIHIALNSGDVIVLYTDGVTEAENDRGELYGMNRLCDVVSKNCQNSVDQIKKAVIDDLRSHIDQHKVYDDITLVVLKQD